MAALFVLVLIQIGRKKQEQLFWSVCLIYLLFLKTVKLLNSIASLNKQKNVSNKHDRTHVKHLNVLYHNRTKKQLQKFFLNILQKYYQLPILGTLGVSGHFHQKWYCQFVETLMFICMQKMNSIPNFFFKILWRYCKLIILTTWERLAMSINIDSITLQEFLMGKVLKSTGRKL